MLRSKDLLPSSSQEVNKAVFYAEELLSDEELLVSNDIDEEMIVRAELPPAPPFCSDAEWKLLLELIDAYEPSFDVTAQRNVVIMKFAYQNCKLLLDGLQEYLTDDLFDVCVQNLWLHYIICNPLNKEMYNKYGIAGREYVVNSVSNSGSSSSLQSFKSLDNANLLFMDLQRTPFGKFVLTYLENLVTAIVIL